MNVFLSRHHAQPITVEYIFRRPGEFGWYVRLKYNITINDGCNTPWIHFFFQPTNKYFRRFQVKFIMIFLIVIELFVRRFPLVSAYGYILRNIINLWFFFFFFHKNVYPYFFIRIQENYWEREISSMFNEPYIARYFCVG